MVGKWTAADERLFEKLNERRVEVHARLRGRLEGVVDRMNLTYIAPTPLLSSYMMDHAASLIAALEPYALLAAQEEDSDD